MNDVLLQVEVHKFAYLNIIASKIPSIQMSWNAELISRGFDAGDVRNAAYRVIDEITMNERGSLDGL